MGELFIIELRYARDNRLIKLRRDLIAEVAWHLDVGFSFPEAESGFKGRAVRPLRWNMSWVQNVVRQFGPYPSWAQGICEALFLVREDRNGRTSGGPVVTPVA